MSFFKYNQYNHDFIQILMIKFSCYSLWKDKLNVLTILDKEDGMNLENEIMKCKKNMEKIYILLDLSNEYVDVLNFYFGIEKEYNNYFLYYSDSAIRNKVLIGLDKIIKNMVEKEKEHEVAG